MRVFVKCGQGRGKEPCRHPQIGLFRYSSIFPMISMGVMPYYKLDVCNNCFILTLYILIIWCLVSSKHHLKILKSTT